MKAVFEGCTPARSPDLVMLRFEPETEAEKAFLSHIVNLYVPIDGLRLVDGGAVEIVLKHLNSQSPQGFKVPEPLRYGYQALGTDIPVRGAE